MAKDAKLELISSVPIFCRLGKAEQKQVAELLDEVDVPAGKVLMRQGEAGSEMFVVVSGRFRVERNGTTIAERGAGAVLGEMAIIAEGPRTATITAEEPSRLFVAGHREFHRLMEEHPQIRAQVLEGLAVKIRAIDDAAAH